MDWINFFKIIGYIALIFGAICTVGVDYLKDKQDDKKDEEKNIQMTELLNDVKDSKKLLEPFNDMATKLFPNLNQKEALEKLSSRLDNIDEEVSAGKEKLGALSVELATEKKTIKSFEVSVYIEFSGIWTGNPYSMWIQNPNNTPYLKWVDTTKKLPDIEFCASKINFKTLSQNTGVFENILTVQMGKAPLGELTNVLLGYNQMILWFPLSWPKNLLNPHIEIDKVRLLFSISGSKKEEIHFDEKIVIDVSESLKNATENSIITPSLILNHNLVDLLKIQH